MASEAHIILKISKNAGRRQMPGIAFCMLASLFATGPAQAEGFGAIVDARTDLAGLSPLQVGVLGFSILIALIGLWMLIYTPRSAVSQYDATDSAPVVIPLPNRRTPAPNPGPVPADATPVVRFSEAVAAARAKMTISEEEDRRPSGD